MTTTSKTMRIWTCDSCGSQTEVDITAAVEGRKKPGPPSGWSNITFLLAPDPETVATRAIMWDLCPGCTPKADKFIEENKEIPF